jgi:hypothetical protein
LWRFSVWAPSGSPSTGLELGSASRQSPSAAPGSGSFPTRAGFRRTTSSTSSSTPLPSCAKRCAHPGTPSRHRSPSNRRGSAGPAATTPDRRPSRRSVRESERATRLPVGRHLVLGLVAREVGAPRHRPRAPAGRAPQRRAIRSAERPRPNRGGRVASQRSCARGRRPAGRTRRRADDPAATDERVHAQCRRYRANAGRRLSVWADRRRRAEELETATGTPHRVHGHASAAERFDVPQDRAFRHLELVSELASGHATARLQEPEEAYESASAHKQKLIRKT